VGALVFQVFNSEHLHILLVPDSLGVLKRRSDALVFHLAKYVLGYDIGLYPASQFMLDGHSYLLPSDFGQDYPCKNGHGLV
jgi:hypothetical protein